MERRYICPVKRSQQTFIIQKFNDMTTTTDTAIATITNDKQTVVASASYVRPYDGGTSAKYVAIDSEQLILELQKRGFVLRQINRAKSGKGRHIVRMRSAEFTEINGRRRNGRINSNRSFTKPGRAENSDPVGSIFHTWTFVRF